MFLCFHLSIHLLRSDMLSFIGTYRYKWSVKELYKMPHWCNEQLQQFSHMNKKALDQHEVSDEALQKRQAELEASDEVLWYWILMLKYLLFYLLFLMWDYNLLIFTSTTNISSKKADWAWAWCERPARENFRTYPSQGIKL